MSQIEYIRFHRKQIVWRYSYQNLFTICDLVIYELLKSTAWSSNIWWRVTTTTISSDDENVYFEISVTTMKRSWKTAQISTGAASGFGAPSSAPSVGVRVSQWRERKGRPMCHVGTSSTWGSQKQLFFVV